MQGDLSYEGVNDVEQSGPLKSSSAIDPIFAIFMPSSNQQAASWLNAERVKNYMGL